MKKQDKPMYPLLNQHRIEDMEELFESLEKIRAKNERQFAFLRGYVKGVEDTAARQICTGGAR